MAALEQERELADERNNFYEYAYEENIEYYEQENALKYLVDNVLGLLGNNRWCHLTRTR